MKDEVFPTVRAVLEYLIAAGYVVPRRTLYHHVRVGKLVESPAGGYDKFSVDRYAAANLTKDNSETDDPRTRLVTAQAAWHELRVRERRGELLLVEEEEARDAQILSAVKRHLELAVPGRIKQMLSDISDILDEEQISEAATRLPVWIEAETDRIAEVFDQLAQAGGVE